MIFFTYFSILLSLIFPFNISSKRSLNNFDEIYFFPIFSLNSPSSIISLYNFKNSSLSFNQLIFFAVSFLMLFFLSKKVPVSLCLSFISKPLRSYLSLVSLCLPFILNPLASCISRVSLYLPFILNPLGSHIN